MLTMAPAKRRQINVALSAACGPANHGELRLRIGKKTKLALMLQYNLLSVLTWFTLETLLTNYG